MRFRLDIDYPIERMEQNRRRMEARAQFAYVDRVPVGFCLVPRHFAPVLGIPYSALFRSVEEHFHWQLQSLKHRIESIPEAMAPCGGSLLGDGANVCPGTPVENLAALTEAAEGYGFPPIAPRRAGE